MSSSGKEVVPAGNPTAEEPIILQSDRETDDDNEAIIVLKAHVLGSGSNPVNKGSDCSSHSASAFTMVPSSNPKRKQREKEKYTEREEIIFLEGLGKFWEHGRNNKWSKFPDHIKGKIDRQFTNKQIAEKIRGLKRKYYTNVARRTVYGRLDLTGHELVLFELSKKLWDDKSRIPSVAGEGTRDEENLQKARVGFGNKDNFEAEFPLLCASFEDFGCSEFLRDSCHLISRDKAKELEEKWQELKSLELAHEKKWLKQ